MSLDLRGFIDQAIAYEGIPCLIWPFHRNENGYAKKGKGYAYSLICERIHGQRPSPRHVARHLCGNGHLGCVAGSHLVWSTQKENIGDRSMHGTLLQGERHPRHKLTTQDVLEIRRLYPGESQVAIAKKFGITQGNVWNIINFLTWRHVSSEADQ